MSTTTLDPEVEITAETVTIPEDITEVGCTWAHEIMDEPVAKLMRRMGRVYVRGCSGQVVAHVVCTRCGKAPASFICRNVLDFFNAALAIKPGDGLCRGCLRSGLPEPFIHSCWKAVIL